MEIHDNHRLMLPFLSVSLLLFSLLLFSLYTRRRRRHSPPVITDIVRGINSNDHSTSIQNLKSHDLNSNNSLLLEILPAILEENQVANDGETTAVGDEECGKKKKKKKRRGRKKRSDCDDSSKAQMVIKDGLIAGIGEEKEHEDLVCLYPFTSSSSATQRKIKQQYDQLVKSYESNGLTLLQDLCRTDMNRVEQAGTRLFYPMEQGESQNNNSLLFLAFYGMEIEVGHFVNCLIEARDELKHKSEVIHRKFTITKALLFKADKSSFDRLRQQIYKLELEQKRVEEDAFVYNWLQQQLKLSPAYKKMLEIGAYMESKAKSVEPTEDTDSDISDISFEELLAREKKDTFWQKKGKPRSGSD